MSDTKSVTIQDLTDAIEKNGIKHVRNHMWDSFTDLRDREIVTVIRGGCAMAQGVMNLGVIEGFFGLLQEQLGDKIRAHAAEHIDVFGLYPLHAETLPDRIVYLNDQRGLTLGEIAAQLRTEYEPLLNEVIKDVPVHTYIIDPNAITTPEQAEKELVIAVN